MSAFARGPTGSYPQGKLTADDDGELQIEVFVGKDDRVGHTIIVRMGTPVKWLGMPPVVARKLAAALIACADSIDKGKGET
jgi:hypothetical protein